MSDAKTETHEEVHGISSAVEDTPHVVAGYGETAKREGAKTKEVRNVSTQSCYLRKFLAEQSIGRAFCCYRGN